jgi:hypothetical protein
MIIEHPILSQGDQGSQGRVRGNIDEGVVVNSGNPYCFGNPFTIFITLLPVSLFFYWLQ